MKRTLYFRKWLALLLLSVVAVGAHGSHIYGTYFEFNILSEDEKTVEICDHNRNLYGDVWLPATVEYEGVTYRVTTIAGLGYNPELVSVTIPEGVTTIRENAFYGCNNLKKVSLPEGLTSIGNYAFHECNALKSVILPSTLTKIGYGCFSDNTENVAYMSKVAPQGWFSALGNSTVAYVPEDCFPEYGHATPNVKYTLSEKTPMWYLKTYFEYGLKERETESCNFMVDDVLYPSVYKIEEAYGDSFKEQWSQWRKQYGAFVPFYIPSSTKEDIKDLMLSIETDTLRANELRSRFNKDAGEILNLRDNWQKYTQEYTDFAAQHPDIEALLAQAQTLYEVGTPLSDEEQRFLDSIWAARDYAEMNLIMRCDSFMFFKEQYFPTEDTEPKEFMDERYQLEDLTNRLAEYGATLEDMLARLTEECRPQVIDGVQYQLLADTTATVVGYEGEGAQVVILDSIAFDGLMFPVKKIGNAAFKGLDIASVDIPETVEVIEDEAFADCYLLVTIICRHRTVPPIVIGSAFRNCGIHGVGGGNGSGFFSTVYVYHSAYKYFADNDKWKRTFTIIYHWSYKFTGYATVYTTIADLQIPEGVKAYTGIISGNRVILNEIKDKIPVGTPAIVFGTAGDHAFYFTTGAAPVGQNDLKGTEAPLVADGKQYILFEKENYAFYKATPGTTIPAGKAYIEYNGADVRNFSIGMETTGIAEAPSDEIGQNVVIYDLSGRRVKKANKGVYINNGIKVLK